MKKIKMDDYDDFDGGGSIAGSDFSEHTELSGDKRKLNHDSEDEEEESKKDPEEDEISDDEVPMPGPKTGSTKIIEIDGPTEGRTKPIMTKFEYARLLGVRMASLDIGSPPIKTDTLEIDVWKIAEEEIREGLCPIIILRRIGPYVERWYRRRKSNGEYTMELPP